MQCMPVSVPDAALLFFCKAKCNLNYKPVMLLGAEC